MKLQTKSILDKLKRASESKRGANLFCSVFQQLTLALYFPFKLQ
jgi:hypothetical protein